MPFTCSICGEESTRICARCTKDACDNHLCEKCLRCSDCCECDVALSESVHNAPADPVVVRPAVVTPAAEPDPEPAPPVPPPAPDPTPEEGPAEDPVTP